MESDAGPIFHQGRTYFIKPLSLLIGSLRITPHVLRRNVNVSKAVMGQDLLERTFELEMRLNGIWRET